MSLVTGCPDTTARAEPPLTDALHAQLCLLHAWLPLPVCVLACTTDDDARVLASYGCWGGHDGQARLAALVEQGQWTVAAEYPGFQHRVLDAREQAGLAGILANSSALAEGLLRYPLQQSDDQVSAWLIAVVTSSRSVQAQVGDFAVDHIQHALMAMGLTLRLHANILALKRELHELQLNAFTEPLTGVLNRAGWANRVEHLESLVQRSQEDVAIVMLDLDLLKLVNDLQGHTAGDELLQLTAHTLQSVLRRGDVVGRLGGDEFGVAVKGVTPRLGQAVVRRLRSALDDVGVEVSMGLALKSEAGGISQALALADARMYEEKRAKPLPERAMDWRRDALQRAQEPGPAVTICP